jgi:hypothetical protein
MEQRHIALVVALLLATPDKAVLPMLPVVLVEAGLDITTLDRRLVRLHQTAQQTQVAAVEHRATVALEL